MKQLRWVIALVVAAVAVIAAFFVVDHFTKKQEEEKNRTAAKQLFSFDPDKTTRITIDNSDGHFAFDWDATGGVWKLVSSEQFSINSYAISAVLNYFCRLSSEKTVEFEAQNTSIYGFDDPVTIKVYTSLTGEDNPYVLTVGDCTPTYDAFYAMIGGSNDVYTIDYTSGSYFCLSKDSLKNAYLFDTFSTLVEYYKLERGDDTIMELKRNDDSSWRLLAPAQDMTMQKSTLDNLMDSLVRVQINAYIEEKPQDLAKYGLDKPHTKLTLRGSKGTSQMAEEIWFGDMVSDREDETLEYGYFKNSDQVFTIHRGDVSFTQRDLVYYLSPYCTNINIEDLDTVDIDMGEVYDLHETLYVDYANGQYALGSTDIDALNSENVSEKFESFYRSISNLRINDTDLSAKPEGDPAITITYHLKAGGTRVLEFIPASENSFWLMTDGKYTGLTVRLNRFTAAGMVTKCYEELVYAIKTAQ